MHHAHKSCRNVNRWFPRPFGSATPATNTNLGFRTVLCACRGGVPALDKTIDLTLAAANLVAIHKYGTTRGLGVLDVKLRILRGKVVNGEAVREKPQCTPKLVSYWSSCSEKQRKVFDAEPWKNAGFDAANPCCFAKQLAQGASPKLHRDAARPYPCAKSCRCPLVSAHGNCV